MPRHEVTGQNFLEPFEVFTFFQVLLEISDYLWFVATLINTFKYSIIQKYVRHTQYKNIQI